MGENVKIECGEDVCHAEWPGAVAASCRRQHTQDIFPDGVREDFEMTNVVIGDCRDGVTALGHSE